MEFANFRNIAAFQKEAASRLTPDLLAYLEGGADDGRTVRRNQAAFQQIRIRPQVLRDVSKPETSLTLFGQKYASPIMLAPVGILGMFHPEGARAVAKAARNKGVGMAASTVTNFSFTEIVDDSRMVPWFQLYPTSNVEARKKLIRRAEEKGCKVLVATVDVPVIGNREKHARMVVDNFGERTVVLGNLVDLLKPDDQIHIPTLTWEYIAWLKGQTKMKIILKGIQTAEDALLAIQHGVDGIVVSNHGGRQLETDRATIECLEEVVTTVNGRMPILLDGGIRRGTDVFKALALGATTVAIGRPYIYGLVVGGQAGVEQVLDIFQAELVRAMQLAGVEKLEDINGSFVRNP